MRRGMRVTPARSLPSCAEINVTSLQWRMYTTSTIADTAKMTTKHSDVRPSASGDTMKRYFVMVVPMSAAVANESP